MMRTRLVTPVEMPGNLPRVSYDTSLLSVGSCFSEHMGLRLRRLGFDCMVNPSGVLFNPHSIADLLSRMLDGRPYCQDELVFHDGLWHSYNHHGSFSRQDAGECLESCNGSLKEATDALERLDVLILTFGTAWVYELRESGKTVANCHKMPSGSFLRRLLGVDEIVEKCATVFEGLLRRRPGLEIMLQVSPIRHMGDGLHQNQVSKATLLLAVERLQEMFPYAVSYFPSYELMMDEMRDYRFYEQDMAHPSTLAREMIWERFSETVMDGETQSLVREVEALLRLMEHRLLHPTAEAKAQLMAQINSKVAQLKEKRPYFDFTKELESCRIRLTE